MADLSRLYDFVNGTVIDAEQVDAELNQLIQRINDIDSDSLAAALAAVLGVSQTGAVRRGKAIIPTTESRTNTVYGLMPTPDRVSNISVPADALVLVAYQALWQESVADTAHAAIFIGANQLKVQGGIGGGGTPGVQAARTKAGSAGLDQTLCTFPAGLVSQAVSPTTSQNPAVTTGQALAIVANSGVLSFDTVGGFYSSGSAGAFGGFCIVDNLAAGTYDFSVQFNSSSGSVTVKDRRLKVIVLGF